MPVSIPAWRAFSLTFEHGHGLHAQFGFGAENGFHGEVRNEDAGERHVENSRWLLSSGQA
jgi:hypothetical protein